MKKSLGFAFTVILLVGLVGCSEENADVKTKDNKVKAAESINIEAKEEVKKEEVIVKPKVEITELTETVAKEFYELFSKKIINHSNSTISQPVEDFFEKPLEPGFYYGLPAGAQSESATDEVAVYYHLLKVVGMPLEESVDQQETHNYTLIENTDDKIKILVDYQLVVGDKTFNEKREVILKLVNKELKIERFEALESPVVDIMQKANRKA